MPCLPYPLEKVGYGPYERGRHSMGPTSLRHLIFFFFLIQIQVFLCVKSIFLNIAYLFQFLKVLRSHYKSQKRHLCWPNSESSVYNLQKIHGK